MSRLSAFTLTALTLLATACSELRCPKGRVQDGQYCRRCPDGSEPKHNLCILTDGGGVVDPIEEGEEDAGGDTEEQEDASFNSDPSEGASDASMDSGGPSVDASDTSEAGTAGDDASVDSAASSNADGSTPSTEAEAGVIDAGPPCYADKDKDGVGAGAPVSCEAYGTDAGAGLSLTNNDCDDNNDKRSPSLSDLCGDNIDNDCDGTPDDESNNACGGPCTTQLAHQPGEKCDNGLKGACARDGTWQCSGKTATVCNATSVAAGQEVCGDGVDNDCDGSKDESDAIDAVTWYRDCDGDGYPSSGSGTNSCVRPSATVGCSGWTDLPPTPKTTEDCDDSSSAYNPGVRAFDLPPIGKISPDLNCDGMVEKLPAVQYTTPGGTFVVATCDVSKSCSACSMLDCSLAEGTCGGAQWLTAPGGVATNSRPACSLRGQAPYNFRLVTTAVACVWQEAAIGVQLCR